jgi:hypothetical protein
MAKRKPKFRLTARRIATGVISSDLMLKLREIEMAKVKGKMMKMKPSELETVMATAARLLGGMSASQHKSLMKKLAPVTVTMKLKEYADWYVFANFGKASPESIAQHLADKFGCSLGAGAMLMSIAHTDVEKQAKLIVKYAADGIVVEN